jgi:hypothetical protein
MAENPFISASHVLGFVAADLKGDGYKEHIVLYDLVESPSSGVVLTIWERGDGTKWGNSIFSEDFAQNNGPGREPTLSLAENGSVEVHSFSTADNPANWEKTLTIAYRHLDWLEYPTYVVVGIRYEWDFDGNADDRRLCEINLMTGRGELTRLTDQKVERFTSPLEPEKTDSWPRNMIPEQCF